MTETCQGEEIADEMELEELLEEFCPGGEEGIGESSGSSNLVNAMILYQITGREVDNCMSRWQRRVQTTTAPCEEAPSR